MLDLLIILLRILGGLCGLVFLTSIGCAILRTSNTRELVPFAMLPVLIVVVWLFTLLIP